MIAVHPAQDAEPVPSLETLYCYLTAGCNLACRHCWLSPRRDTDGTHEQVLPVALFEKAIQEAKPLGLKGVKLTGGEPLLHPDIGKILAVVERERLSLTMETNGVLCTPALAVHIARLPGSFVSVSIDGADALTHDRARGVPGAFDKAREGVRSLVAAGVSPQIVMTLSRGNAPQIEGVVRLAEGLGASSVKFNLTQPAGRGASLHERHEVLTVEALIALGRRVEREVTAGTSLPLHFDYPAAFRPLSRLASGLDDGTCRIRGILGLLPGGEYALCGVGTVAPGLVFGSARLDPLARVWRESPLLRELRRGLPRRLGGICGRCLIAQHCLGSCLAQNYLASRSLWQPFWFCAEAEILGLFPVSRLATG